MRSHLAMSVRRHTLSACMGLARLAVAMLVALWLLAYFSSPSAVPLTAALGLSSRAAVSSSMRWPFFSWCRRVSA